MGTLSMSFYILATWIAPIMLSRGASDAAAGAGVTVFHIFGMAGSLVSPLLLRRDGRAVVQVLLPTILGASLLGFILIPGVSLISIPFLGFTCGAGLSVALTLIAQRSSDASVATATSEMSQSVGYFIAAAGPVLFGWTHDLTAAWMLPLLIAMGGVAAQFAAGWVLRDGRMVHL